MMAFWMLKICGSKSPSCPYNYYLSGYRISVSYLFRKENGSSSAQKGAASSSQFQYCALSHATVTINRFSSPSQPFLFVFLGNQLPTSTSNFKDTGVHNVSPSLVVIALHSRVISVVLSLAKTTYGDSPEVGDDQRQAQTQLLKLRLHERLHAPVRLHCALIRPILQCFHANCNEGLLTLPYFACHAKKYKSAARGCPTKTKLIQKIQFPIVLPPIPFILASSSVSAMSGI